MNAIRDVVFGKIEELDDDQSGQFAPLALHLVGFLGVHDGEHLGVVDDSVDLQKLMVEVEFLFQVRFEVLLIEGEASLETVQFIFGPLW